MSALVRLLVAARKRIAPRGRWTQGRLAKNRHGHGLAPDSSAACSWCAEGTIDAEASITWRRPCWAPRLVIVNVALASLNAGLPDLVHRFNDAPGRTQRDVLRAFDRAIAQAKRAARKGAR